MKTIKYLKQPEQFLREINKSDADKIKSKINQYATDPESLKNNVKKLQGIKLYRLRVGNYRVVFDENLIVIEVVKIGLRGNVYNKINKLRG